jgi:xanthine/CO dehydrogenase XdhC/CoxF family maturation factor
MENLDVMVLRTLRDWRQAGKRALLATVVRTWGSSPRPIGSIMALAEDGSVVGSVSGGCIEDDLIYRHTQAYSAREPGHQIPSGPPSFVKYGVTADEAHRFGLPCGGTLELLLEYDPDAATLDRLVQALESGRLMRRTVRVADGAVTLEEASAPQELSLDGGVLVNTFGPEYRMLLIGAGQLTEYLATMALYVGAIGSRRNNEARHQRMVEHFEVSAADLQRLRGPIGIYIGSKTPAEIAVSIMAEVLAVKNGITLPRDMEVAQAKNLRAVQANDPGIVCAVGGSRD